MMAEPQPLLRVRDLRTWFHTFAGVVKAVNGVSFDLAAGEIMGLVGESGGGKSVVGYSLLGLIDPPGRIEGGVDPVRRRGSRDGIGEAAAPDPRPARSR